MIVLVHLDSVLALRHTGANAGIDVTAQSLWAQSTWLPKDDTFSEVAENGRTTRSVTYFWM